MFGPTLVGWTGNRAIPSSADGSVDPQIDRLPLEATLGWDASQNGNLAELLQEPSLMGALEGAGITVLAKGVKFPVGASNIAWSRGHGGRQLPDRHGAAQLRRLHQPGQQR